MDLPKFKYFLNPLFSKVYRKVTKQCCSCNKIVNYIYVGPTYYNDKVNNFDECICPWCIYDGTAHINLNVSFVDKDAIGNYGEWSPVNTSIIEEISNKTPCFLGIQQEKWWTHCNEGGQFLGTFSYFQMHDKFNEVELNQIMTNIKLLKDMKENDDLSFCIFKCVNCNKLGGYVDFF